MAVDQNEKAARDALTFMLAPEGKFFREFMLEEIVRGIDALTRNQLAELVSAPLSNWCLVLIIYYQLTCLRSATVVPAYQPTYFLSYRPTYCPTYLLSYLPTYQPTYLPEWQPHCLSLLSALQSPPKPLLQHQLL